MRKIRVRSPMRIPTDKEWDRLVEVTGGDDSVMHWSGMTSWVNKVDLRNLALRAYRGYFSARLRLNSTTSIRFPYLGFRPAIDITADTRFKDGATVIMGTLFMDGQPVRVPQHPFSDGDVQKYIPGTALEMHPALDDPDYQVVGIRVGNAIIADRNLLCMISYEDIEAGVTLR